MFWTWWLELTPKTHMAGENWFSQIVLCHMSYMSYVCAYEHTLLNGCNIFLRSTVLGVFFTDSRLLSLRMVLMLQGHPEVWYQYLLDSDVWALSLQPPFSRRVSTSQWELDKDVTVLRNHGCQVSRQWHDQGTLWCCLPLTGKSLWKSASTWSCMWEHVETSFLTVTRQLMAVC